jgi:hypothetical protein
MEEVQVETKKEKKQRKEKPVKYTFSKIYKEDPTLYFKQYYIEIMKPTIQCECGTEITKCMLKRHLNTKIHASRLKNKIVV